VDFPRHAQSDTPKDPSVVNAADYYFCRIQNFTVGEDSATGGGGEQTKLRGAATARGRRLDGGSSRLNFAARRLTGGGSFSVEARGDAAILVAERERVAKNSLRLYCRSPKEIG